MKKLMCLGLFVIILCLESATCQFPNDQNDILEWYYNLNQQNFKSKSREVRQSRRFGNNFASNEDEDEWYVFDEVVPESQPQTPSGNNQFGWFRNQQQPSKFDGSFGFRPNTIPTTTTGRPLPQIPNAGPRRPSRCIENCFARTTPEYNPVCATNGETYNNEAKMNCAVICGANVQIRRFGRCDPLLP